MNKTIFCVKCQKEVNANLITGKQAYPHRPDLYKKYFWKCPVCGNFVGCHKNSKTHEPLGVIPTLELKKARMKAHYFIDRLWQSGKYTRKQVYKLLSSYMGYHYHTATTKTLEECEKVITKAKELWAYN